MKKLLTILILFSYFTSFGQTPRRIIGAFQYQWFSADSALQGPTGCGTPTYTPIRKEFAAHFDSCNHRYWVWDPKLSAWDSIHVGVSGGGLNFGQADTLATADRFFNLNGNNKFKFKNGNTPIVVFTKDSTHFIGDSASTGSYLNIGNVYAGYYGIVSRAGAPGQTRYISFFHHSVRKVTDDFWDENYMFDTAAKQMASFSLDAIGVADFNAGTYSSLTWSPRPVPVMTDHRRARVNATGSAVLTAQRSTNNDVSFSTQWFVDTSGYQYTPLPQAHGNTATDSIVVRSSTATNGQYKLVGINEIVTTGGIVVPIANGGTNSSTALNNNRFIVSSGGKIQEASAVSKYSQVWSDANGLPVNAAVNEFQQVAYATTTALAANTYNNGTSGVGATLTANSNGAIAAIDGVTPVANDRVLVMNEAAAANNGIYIVTQVGDASHPYILTRDNYAAIPANLAQGANVFVQGGTANGNSVFFQKTAGAITVGTTALAWSTLSKYIRGDKLPSGFDSLETRRGSNLDTMVIKAIQHLDQEGNVVTNTVNDSTVTINTQEIDPTNEVYAGLKMGSQIKTNPIWGNITQLAAQPAMTSQAIEWIMMQPMTKAQTITGVAVWQSVQGSFTANNYNGVGLYTIDTTTGTMTRVDTSANSASQWKNASGTLLKIPFSFTYAAAKNTVYIVALMYSQSAQTTAPSLGGGQGLTQAGAGAVDFVHSIKFIAETTGQTALPTTQLMSGTGSQNTKYWCGLY